jgi:hypothetical protein
MRQFKVLAKLLILNFLIGHHEKDDFPNLLLPQRREDFFVLAIEGFSVVPFEVPSVSE